MPVTKDFIALAEGLVINGYQYATQYAQGLSPPANFYIILLNNGSPVAVLPVSKFEYVEYSGKRFRLTYTAYDSSSSEYTFDEVQLVASNNYVSMYTVTDDLISSPVSKPSFVPLTVSVTVELEIETNTFEGTIPAFLGIGPLQSPFPIQVPPCELAEYCLFGAPYPTLPLNIIAFLVLQLLIPTSQYSNISNTMFYKTLQIVQIPLDQVSGIKYAGIVGIVLVPPGGYKYTNCELISTFFPFRPKPWMSQSIVTAFEDMGNVLIPAITILTTLNTTEFYEVVLNVSATTE
mgnify:CR=1 FL=1